MRLCPSTCAVRCLFHASNMGCIPALACLAPRPEHDPSQVKKFTIQSTSPFIRSTFMRQAWAKYNSERYLGGKRRSQTGSASSTLINTIQELYSAWVKLQRGTSKIDRDIMVTISLGLEHKPQCEEIFLRTDGWEINCSGVPELPSTSRASRGRRWMPK